jgi:hypothetical protein
MVASSVVSCVVQSGRLATVGHVGQELGRGVSEAILP